MIYLYTIFRNMLSAWCLRPLEQGTKLSVILDGFRLDSKWVCVGLKRCLGVLSPLLPCPPLAGCRELGRSPIDIGSVLDSHEVLYSDEASLHFIRFRVLRLILMQI